MTQNTVDVLACDHFVAALDDRLAFKVREREPETLREALTAAVKLEALYDSRKDTPRPRNVRAVQSEKNDNGGDVQQFPAAQTEVPPAKPDGRNESKEENRQENQIGNLRRKADSVSNASAAQPENQPTVQKTAAAEIEELRREVEHLRATLAQTAAPAPASTAPVTSLPFTPWPAMPQSSVQPPTQWMPAHSPLPQPAATPSWTDHHQPGMRDPPPLTQQRLPVCYNCREPGHYSRNCPKPRRPKFNGQQQSSNTCNINAQRAEKALVYIRARINGNSLLCLHDTGCDTTLLPSTIVEPHQLKPLAKQLCRAANGSPIRLAGIATVTATIDGFPVEIHEFVTDHISLPMLGFDWMSRNDVQWRIGAKNVRIAGRTVRLQTKKGTCPRVCRVTLENDVTLPPRSQLDVSTKKVFNSILDLDSVTAGTAADDRPWGTEPRKLRRGLLVEEPYYLEE